MFTLPAWLSWTALKGVASKIPWAKVGIGVGLVVVLILGLSFLKGCSTERTTARHEAENTLVDKGAAQTTLHVQSETINHVAQANDARSRPTPADEQRVCEKYDRNCPGHGHH